VGRVKGIGRIRLQAAVDVLYDRVMPLYEAHDLKAGHILTDNGTEYCGKAMIRPHRIFLELNDIEHRRVKAARPRADGFVERFNRILDEFFRITFRDKLCVPAEELQADLDKWLHYYNYERPQHGQEAYRNN